MTVLTASSEGRIDPAAIDPAPAPRWRRPLGWMIGLLKFAAGVVCCQGPLLSVLVVGSTQHRMRRSALRRWDLPDEAASVGFFRRLFRMIKGGAAAAANVFLATLPATGLWYLAWLLGWNISFHKQYEQAHLGISLGLTGVAVFAAIMLYVPVALGRQATVGDWRAFWRWGENWRMVRFAAADLLVWTFFFAMLAFVLMGFRIAPYFVAGSDEFRALSDAEVVEWANQYYLMTGVLLLPAYVLLWKGAARTYANALLKWGCDRKQGAGSLLEIEQSAINHAAKRPPTAPSDRFLARFVRVTTAWIGRAGATFALGATFFIWTTVALQVFVAQFFYYIPGQGWLNHPLILLPWMRYLPPGLTP